jgi:hypothetical protein
MLPHHQREDEMSTAKGKTAKHHMLIRRLFNGLPVIDSKRELRVFASPKDIKDAKRNDPTNCVFANACRRLYGSHSVAFFHNYAYVELPDERGNQRIERFRLPKQTQTSIVVFDKTGIADKGGYVLAAPSPGVTLDRKLQIGREYIRPARSKSSGAHKKRGENIDFRSGTGLVQFIRASKNWVRSP